MTQRRVTDLLPTTFQTPTNERFFSSTADELFQPGSAEQVSGFIGEVPSYYDPTKDFYLTEPTRARATYQLAPVMISKDATGKTTHLFGYDDLINYLRESSAIVSDENRLFSDAVYAWAPPVDIDKLLNFHQYLWFGDNPSLIPSVKLRAGRTTATGDGQTLTYPLPPVQGGVATARETPMAVVDGVPIAVTVANGVATLSSTPKSGAAVSVFRYGDLRAVITGLAGFDATAFLADDIPVTALTSNMRLLFDDGLSGLDGYDLLPFAAAPEATVSGCPLFVDVPWDKPFGRATNDFFAEGIGSDDGITLVPSPQDATDYVNPMYVTIDRRSRDRNPWSVTNLWVHRDAVAFSGADFRSRRGLRPIVEFKPYLELYNYGWRRLADIQAMLTGSASYIPKATTHDPVNIGNVEGSVAVPLEDLGGQPLGHIIVDAGHLLREGERFIARQTGDMAIDDCIVQATAARGQTPTGPNPVVMTFRVVHRPVLGDIVALNPRGYIPFDATVDGSAWSKQPWDYDATPFTYHYTTAGWVPSANIDPLQDPLFALYTADGIAHDALPTSTFAGNRLFGFTAGSGAVDPILLRPLSYQTASSASSTSEILMTNDQVTVRGTSAGAPIPGYQFYRVVAADGGAKAFENGWFPVPDLSQQILSNGIFSLPANLSCNPDMEEVDATDRSRYFDQFVALLRRQTGFSGSPFQRNIWRDTARHANAAFPAGRTWAPNTAYAIGDTVANGFFVYRCTVAHTSGTAFDVTNWLVRPVALITQPRSPLLKTMLLSADSNFDYQDAVRFSDSEYQRFRNKFFAKITDVLESGACVEADADEVWVETILKALKVAKTPAFPFALSAMAGGGYFIPPTASSLGLMPVAFPGVEVDDLVSSAYVDVRGHDGSRTPYAPGLNARIMLALEMRIWRNIPAKFRTEARPLFDFDLLIESRASGVGGANQSLTLPDICDPTQTPVQSTSLLYAPDEIVRILTPAFLRWAQLNNYDYRSNTTYDPGQPFTWNYRGYKDKDGYVQRGNYRAIYRWFFDTERPHIVPWQMLGFISQPTWWEAEYGPAPYTSGNIVLWSDLRDGRVRQGVRAGIDARYTRPDLLSILPVDENGELLDPIVTGIMPTAPTQPDAQRDWEFGDQGPIENIWINSASYPFARAILGFLLRPAQWTEIGWNTLDYNLLPDGQWYNGVTADRPRSAVLTVHGETDPVSGLPVPKTGIQQWVVDLMTSRAQKPILLGSAVRGLQARLSHKMAAFTQAKSLRIFADNFGILPAEDTEVVLHASPPLREAIYSGVIIEWTGAGWAVVGYDTEKNGFCIIPGVNTSTQKRISLGDDPQIFEWVPLRTYQMNVLVDYLGSVYRCTQTHTSGRIFDTSFWSPAAIAISRFPKVVVYLSGEPYHTFVPYGTVFSTTQEVAEFLWDWARSQIADGFVFDAIDPATGDVQDWELAIRQFLEWSQMDWQPGNFISLSPGASSLKFVTSHGMVLNLNETVNGLYPLLDRTGRPVGRRATFISRIDDTTLIQCSTNNLFSARLRVGEIEHALVFSNLTVFGDVIYRPLYSLRQPRLRLIGLRTRNWSGRLDAPGYVVNGNDIMANFDRASENLRTMFEIEGSEDSDLRDHARHVVGYQKRPYLDNLLISETQQFEFYQGMIQAKGSPGVFERLTRSKIVDDDVDLKFLEEWGFQVGQFGATDVRTRFSFRLDQTDLRGNPQFVFFGDNDPYDSIVALPAGDDRWIIQPKDVGHVFPSIAPKIITGATSPQVDPALPALPTAGPVRIDEVDVSCFSPDFFEQLYTQAVTSNAIVDGWTVWVFNMITGDRGYDVLRAYPVGDSSCRLIKIETQKEDPTLEAKVARFTFTGEHGLASDDADHYFVVGSTTATNPDQQGFTTITRIDSSTSIVVSTYLTSGMDLSTVSSPVYCFIMRSQRFPTVATRDAFYARYPMVVGQYCYVDEVSV